MDKIDQSELPKHVAIIMDGNGRWAKKKHLPKIAGHAEGVKRVEDIIKAAKGLGVKTITLFAFSTENWKRPRKEVDALMKLLEIYLDQETNRMVKEGVKIRAIGRIRELPHSVQLRLRSAEEKTQKNKDILLNLALNYGSRSEIVDAAKKIARDVKENKFDIEDLNEKKFSKYLYTSSIPDPELIIRTSGEMRLSNFLLWQASYSEIYVTKKFWPDFKKQDFENAILDYTKRERRYGG